jgi:hypothetical protein
VERVLCDRRKCDPTLVHQCDPTLVLRSLRSTLVGPLAKNATFVRPKTKNDVSAKVIKVDVSVT